MSSVVKSEKEEINVKAKLSPKIEEKNICDLLETASKSDTSHEVEVDPEVVVKEEPNTSSCSTPRVLNTYFTQQTTQNGSQEDESK